MDVPVAMYRDEIEIYKEELCSDFAADCDGTAPHAPPDSANH